MVIKGRIHGELGKFEIYLQNSVKSDKELRLEIGSFIILRKITGGVRPPSPPRHDTMAPVEPTPTHVQPPRHAKTKDPEFHYTK